MEIPLWEVGDMMVINQNILFQKYRNLKSRNIKEIPGDLVIDDTYFDFQKIPGGWQFTMTLGIIMELEFGA